MNAKPSFPILSWQQTTLFSNYLMTLCNNTMRWYISCTETWQSVSLSHTVQILRIICFSKPGVVLWLMSACGYVGKYCEWGRLHGGADATNICIICNWNCLSSLFCYSSNFILFYSNSRNIFLQPFRHHLGHLWDQVINHFALRSSSLLIPTIEGLLTPWNLVRFRLKSLEILTEISKS